MQNILLFFGGKSCEHDISIITGMQYAQCADEYLYKIIPVYIDQFGEWCTGKKLFDLSFYNAGGRGKIYKCAVVSNDKNLYIYSHGKYKRYIYIDAAVLCLHGGLGENGGLAGILENSGIPYTSSSMCGSSVCMDKVVFKYFCKGLGVPVVDGAVVTDVDYYGDTQKCKSDVEKLGYPVIIKPSRLGSSIGIEIAKNPEELDDCIAKSMKFDKKLLIEKLIDVDKEVNIAVFEYKGELIVSLCEEPVRSGDILSFKEKYVATGFQGIKRKIPADIDDDVYRAIKDMACLVYQKLGLFGVVRFDFLLTPSGDIYLNEVNTIPGSMANYLFDKTKFDYRKLQNMWIHGAIMRNENKEKLQTGFDSGVLKNGINSIKK